MVLGRRGLLATVALISLLLGEAFSWQHLFFPRVQSQSSSSSSKVPRLPPRNLAAASACCSCLLLLCGWYPEVASAATAGAGEKLFQESCVACHVGGGNVIGFARGKTLEKGPLEKNGFKDAASIAALVKGGKGIMPGYGPSTRKDGTPVPATLSDEQIMQVSQFVLERAADGWR